MLASQQSARLAAFTALLVSGSFMCSGAALPQGYSGNMRAIIGPDAAVDSITYEEYRRCLGSVPLNQDARKISAARDACKEKALKSAYRLPPQERTVESKTGLRPVPSVEERTGAQKT